MVRTHGTGYADSCLTKLRSDASKDGSDWTAKVTRKAMPNLRISHRKAINGLSKKMIFWGSKLSNTALKTGWSFSVTSLADLVVSAVKDGTTCLTQRLCERNGPKKRISSYWNNMSQSALSGLRSLKWSFWKEDQFHRSKTGSTRTWKEKTFPRSGTKTTLKRPPRPRPLLCKK